MFKSFTFASPAPMTPELFQFLSGFKIGQLIVGWYFINFLIGYILQAKGFSVWLLYDF